MQSSFHRSVFLMLGSLVSLLQTNIIKASVSFDESVGGFFESHCNRCHDEYWLTNEALSSYLQSAGLFGLEQHSPIMCIGNGIPALLGRFREQTTKGFLWKDIGLSDWFFDSDSKFDMDRLTAAVLELANDAQEFIKRAKKGQGYVNTLNQKCVGILEENFYYRSSK